MICLLHLNMPAIYSIMCSSLWQLDIDLLFKCLWQETRTLFIAPSIRKFSQKTLKSALRASSCEQQQQQPYVSIAYIIIIIIIIIISSPCRVCTIICPKQTLFLWCDNDDDDNNNNNNNNNNGNKNYYYYYYYIVSMQGMYNYMPETNPVPMVW